jgi:hypothetical protein
VNLATEYLPVLWCTAITTRFRLQLNDCRIKTHINPLNAKLYPICHLLALLGAHHILHVSRVRVNLDTDSDKFNKMQICGFVGLGVSALAFGTQVRGFKPGRNRRIFQSEKILSAPSFGSEVKPWVPCRWFTACKRSLDVLWKLASRQN